MSLPVPNRLKKKKDFDEVFKKGKAVNGSFLFIKTLVKAEGLPRFGFVVASKYAPQAVVRNRVRRLFSRVIWPNLLLNMPSCDTVVVVTKKIPKDLVGLEEDFLSALRKARLI